MESQRAIPASLNGARNPVDWSSSITRKGYTNDNLNTDVYATADGRPFFQASERNMAA
jgi:hypothetical protein